MTRLALARHGETIWHAENRYAGSSDIALTERGLRQSEALGRWAHATGVSTVVSSDLSRAVLTARPSVEAIGVDLIVDPQLREVHFGDAEGMTSKEMERAFSEELERFRARPATQPLPGAESGSAAVERAWPALERIAQHGDGTVLVVMHSTLMRLILCRALEIPLDNYRTAFPNVLNVAVTTVEWPAEGVPSLLGYNVPTFA